MGMAKPHQKIGPRIDVCYPGLRFSSGEWSGVFWAVARGLKASAQPVGALFPLAGPQPSVAQVRLNISVFVCFGSDEFAVS